MENTCKGCPLFDIHMEKKFFKTAKNQLFT
jgi:hypothetical protein